MAVEVEQAGLFQQQVQAAVEVAAQAGLVLLVAQAVAQAASLHQLQMAQVDRA